MADSDYCGEHSGCANQIETNKNNIQRIFEKINKIENRPPVWMSMLFTVAIGVIGYLLKR